MHPLVCMHCLHPNPGHLDEACHQLPAFSLVFLSPLFTVWEGGEPVKPFMYSGELSKMLKYI